MTPGQIANDLRANAKSVERGMLVSRSTLDGLAYKMQRGAQAIEELLGVIAELEAAAEAEAQRFAAYRNGDDLHGAG